MNNSGNTEAYTGVGLYHPPITSAEGTEDAILTAPQGVSDEPFDFDASHAKFVAEQISSLPSLAELPSLTSIDILPVNSPYEIKKPATLGDLLRHLEGANDRSPEIEIDILDNGLNVVRRGVPQRVPGNFNWSFVARDAAITIHTHPDPTSPSYMREPSMPDIRDTNRIDAVHLIGSTLGLTYIPPFYEDVYGSFDEYAAETRKLTMNKLSPFEATRVHRDFIRDVIRPLFIPWGELDPFATLTEVVADLDRYNNYLLGPIVDTETDQPEDWDKPREDDEAKKDLGFSITLDGVTRTVLINHDNVHYGQRPLPRSRHTTYSDELLPTGRYLAKSTII